MRFFLSFLLALSLFFPSISFAQSSSEGLAGYVFNSFHADIAIQEDGSFLVSETLTGEYTEPRHGLFRFIPVLYNRDFGTSEKIDFEIKQVRHNKQPAKFAITRSGPNELIKIGDENIWVEGDFEYEIVYSVDRALFFGDLKDEIYWNVTGNNWDAFPKEVSARVMIPDVLVADLEAQCYTGELGSTQSNCNADINTGEVVFNAREPLTISVAWPKGVIDEPKASQKLFWWIEANWDYSGILAAIFILIFLIRHWMVNGKDPKGKGTIIAQYEPPRNMTPAQVGALIDGTLHARDFSATIIQLAVLGYIQIIENDKAFTIKKVKPADDKLASYEKDLLEALLGSESEVNLKERKNSLISVKKKMQDHLHEELAKQGLYAKNPVTAKAPFFILGILFIVVAFILGPFAHDLTGRPILMMTLFAIGGFFFIFAFLAPKRTHAGVLAYEHAKGFKLFLETAHKDRVKWQEKEGLFEKFLPYAMVFNVADKWAQVFETKDGKTSMPGWYIGPNMNSFSSFEKTVTSFAAVSAAVATVQSSGGSSSGSSGGFSGGGFGGGGGGSW